MSLSFSSNTLLTNQSMAASFTSDAIPLIVKDGYSVHAVYVGSPVGNLILQASINGQDWNDIEASSSNISTAGDILFNVTEANYIYARLKYTFSSGTGTLNAYYSTREEK